MTEKKYEYDAKTMKERIKELVIFFFTEKLTRCIYFAEAKCISALIIFFFIFRILLSSHTLFSLSFNHVD